MQHSSSPARRPSPPSVSVSSAAEAFSAFSTISRSRTDTFRAPAGKSARQTGHGLVQPASTSIRSALSQQNSNVSASSAVISLTPRMPSGGGMREWRHGIVAVLLSW
eukprot:COSAG04_NODE_684_length_11170_cov_4.232228_7_plen_107_part_00